MINLSLLSMRKVLTQFVWKRSLTKTLLLWEEPREETWRELFWLVVEQLSTQLKNWLNQIWDTLMKFMKWRWANKSILLLKASRTQDHALCWLKVQTSTPSLWSRTLLEMASELSRMCTMIKPWFREPVLSKSLAISIYLSMEKELKERPNLVSKPSPKLCSSFQR